MPALFPVPKVETDIFKKCRKLNERMHMMHRRVELSSRDPYKAQVFELTSRQDVGRGRFDHPAGSRGAVTQYTSGAEIIRMPSGSIVSIPPLEPINLSQARFNEALALALLINFGIWGLLALVVRALFF